ncbi:MAG: Panacea domain-containing protein [Rhodothermaceae bacterium]
MYKNLNIEKIGNIIYYLADQVTGINITKALKLLYIIDETSVKESGVPVTFLNYSVWQYGPVAEEVYDDLRHKSPFDQPLRKYVSTEEKINPDTANYECLLLPNSDHTFSDDELSDYEVELVDRIIKEYGSKSATQLVRLLHDNGTLWHTIVIREELKKYFEMYGGRSKNVIEFSDLVEDDPIKKLAMKAAYESLNFQLTL